MSLMFNSPVWFLLICVVSGCVAYEVSISNSEHLQSIDFYKNGNKLPDFLVKYDFSDFVDGNSDARSDRKLRVDTSNALFDTIVVKRKSSTIGGGNYTIVVEVIDKETSTSWKTEFNSLGGSDEGGEEDLMLSLDKNFITAAPLNSVQIIETMQYNGDFIALYHIEYLYDYIDRFIIVEAWYTHSGIRKPFLYFHHNAHLFAPYMTKITYVIIEEFPPVPPPSIWSFATMKFITPGTEVSYWNENYQYTFPSFFIKPTSLLGSRQLVIVSDADEITSREMIVHMKEFEMNPSLPMRKKTFDRPVHLQMLFFYYNFGTINSLMWIQNFALNSDAYLQMLYPLDMRSFGHRADYSFYPGGLIGGDFYGWHLSYFMSLEDMIRKMTSFSAAAEVTDQDIFKTESHIRYCMSHHKDLFNRTHRVDWQGYFSNPAYVQSMRLPEGWEVWQDKLDVIQEHVTPR